MSFIPGMTGLIAAAALPAGVVTLIPQANGTPIGNMTSNGGLAAAFNGNLVQANAASAYLANAAAGTCGKYWGSGVSHIVSKVIVYATSNFGFNNDSDPASIYVDIEGSTDNFSSSVVLLKRDASIINSAAGSAGAILTITGLDVSAAYEYHRMKMTRQSGGNIWANIAELEFYETI